CFRWDTTPWRSVAVAGAELPAGVEFPAARFRPAAAQLRPAVPARRVARTAEAPQLAPAAPWSAQLADRELLEEAAGRTRPRAEAPSTPQGPPALQPDPAERQPVAEPARFK